MDKANVVLTYLARRLPTPGPDLISLINNAGWQEYIAWVVAFGEEDKKQK